MKVFSVIVVACLLAGSQANFLDDLTAAFKNTADGLLAAGKVVGSSLLDQLKTTGMNLASTAVGQLVEKLDSVAAGETSKRDISAIMKTAAPILKELESAMGDHSASQRLLFSLALKELEDVSKNITSLDSTSLKTILGRIDDIVAGHSLTSTLLKMELESRIKAMLPHKRSAQTDLAQVAASLTQAFSQQVTGLETIVSQLGDALKFTASGLMASLSRFQTGQ